MVVSHVPATLLPETEPGTYRLGVLVGHTEGLGVFENKKSVDSAWNQTPDSPDRILTTCRHCLKQSVF